MKIYNTQAEFDSDVVDGVFETKDDVKFCFDLITSAYIKARNIKAWNIDALNIDYYAFCIAYGSISCESISGRRENAKHFCLDGEITIKGESK